MTTQELKALVDQFNDNSPGKMTVDSPSAYSQWRVSYKLTTGFFLINWMSVTDWNPDDTYTDVTLIGE